MISVVKRDGEIAEFHFIKTYILYLFYNCANKKVRKIKGFRTLASYILLLFKKTLYYQRRGHSGQRRACVGADRLY